MKNYSRNISISLPMAILIFFIVLIIVFIGISLKLTDKKLTSDEGPIWLFSIGLVPGLVVALMQFILSWGEFQQISKFSAMNIKGILDSRDQEVYYRELINNATFQIDVLGVTAQRLMNDFADSTATRLERKVLIAALARGVKVRILLPDEKYLTVKDKNEKYPIALRIFNELHPKFSNFEVHYFSHDPIASIFRVDNEILLGQIFNDAESRNTPTIHTSVESPLAQSYVRYFEKEWPIARAL
jgi:hypothetical protein